jgi:hypothetical protein
LGEALGGRLARQGPIRGADSRLAGIFRRFLGPGPAVSNDDTADLTVR